MTAQAKPATTQSTATQGCEVKPVGLKVSGENQSPVYISTEPQTIQGEVHATGITDQGGDSSGIIAEVGFIQADSVRYAADAWTWKPMRFTGSHDNNYVYEGTIRPDVPGTYVCCVRFSCDGGSTWQTTDGVVTVFQRSSATSTYTSDTYGTIASELRDVVRQRLNEFLDNLAQLLTHERVVKKVDKILRRLERSTLHGVDHFIDRIDEDEIARRIESVITGTAYAAGARAGNLLGSITSGSGTSGGSPGASPSPTTGTDSSSLWQILTEPSSIQDIFVLKVSQPNQDITQAVLEGKYVTVEDLAALKADWQTALEKTLDTARQMPQPNQKVLHVKHLAQALRDAMETQVSQRRGVGQQLARAGR